MARHAIDTEGADVSRCLFQMIGKFEKSQLYKEREKMKTSVCIMSKESTVNNCRSGPRHTVYITRPITTDHSNCLLYSIALNKERGSLMYCRELDRRINTLLPSNEPASDAWRVSIACFHATFNVFSTVNPV
jgi:hypothetical protein